MNERKRNSIDQRRSHPILLLLFRNLIYWYTGTWLHADTDESIDLELHDHETYSNTTQ